MTKTTETERPTEDMDIPANPIQLFKSAELLRCLTKDDVRALCERKNIWMNDNAIQMVLTNLTRLRQRMQPKKRKASHDR